MIQFVKPETRYIQSYWEAVDTVCKERIYLASSEGFPLESTIEFVESCIDKHIPQLFVIETATDRCVGWCDAQPKSATIGYLGTGLLSEYREQGIGRQLIQEIITLSKNYGYHRLELDVRSSNTRAIHVYQQLGFVITNVVTGGFMFRDSTIAEDVVQMTLDLTT
ncbi:MAG: GNAT family N-acetyltransferase [Oscillospiraceae bacterium]|nr:GNAT family N-acetyltransferase [Oscillospiraceae bacterium]